MMSSLTVLRPSRHCLTRSDMEKCGWKVELTGATRVTGCIVGSWDGKRCVAVSRITVLWSSLRRRLRFCLRGWYLFIRIAV
jgi:hypothetical protein